VFYLFVIVFVPGDEFFGVTDTVAFRVKIEMSVLLFDVLSDFGRVIDNKGVAEIRFHFGNHLMEYLPVVFVFELSECG